MASAPEASRAWLLIEHPGPWPHEPSDAVLPGSLRDVVSEAAERGIRLQLIRRPGSRGAGDGVWAGWTAGSEPWLRRGSWSGGLDGLDLEGLAGGRPVSFGSAVTEPVFLVCGHAQRNACCARFGGPLGQALAAVSGTGLPDHARGRPPVRRQPGHLAARPVLRPGRAGGGDGRDQRLRAGRGHGGAVPRPGGPAAPDTAGRARGTDPDRLTAGRGARLMRPVLPRPGARLSRAVLPRRGARLSRAVLPRRGARLMRPVLP